MAYSDSATPFVDPYATQRVLAQRYLQNVFQQLIWTDGRGVSHAFEPDGNALEVRIIRHKPLSGNSRTIGEGGATNNSHFNDNSAETPASDNYMLRLNELYDRMVELPQVMDDMISLNVLNATADSIEWRTIELINSYTLAHKIAGAFNYALDSGDTSRVIKFDEANDKMLDKVFEAHKYLNKGDRDNGISTFPLQNRLAVFSADGQYLLQTVEKAVFEVGSSRAVELLEIGSAGDTTVANQVNTDTTGFFGIINQTPLHMIADNIIDLAEQYMDLTQDILVDNFLGVISASQGTLRGMATGNSVKVVDSVRGQGYLFQPKFRWGIEVIYPKSIVVIMKDDFDFATEVTDPITVEGPESQA